MMDTTFEIAERILMKFVEKPTTKTQNIRIRLSFNDQQLFIWYVNMDGRANDSCKLINS